MTERWAELAQMALVMALAAIEADGKDIKAMSEAEKHGYIDSAVADLKLALDVSGDGK